MSRSLSRRAFLKETATAAAAMSAASYARVPGANDRLSVGIIGCGSRGKGVHMPGIHDHSESQNVEITAVCDPWRIAREEAAAKAKEWYGKDVRQFASHRGLLALDDIDAVTICSCDHQHSRQLKDVAEAGKHCYCEKPLARDMDELNAAYDAVKKAGIVVQIGTQLRSHPPFAGCRKLYQTGIFGHVSRIGQVRNLERPFWGGRVKDVKKGDIAWDEFLMGAECEFDPVRYSRWMGFRQFCDGPVPQLAVHFIDLIHYITGAKVPTRCVTMGGVYTWGGEFEFTVPDQVHALWDYPEGFMVSYLTNCGNGSGNLTKILSDEGVLDMTNWDEPTYSADGGVRRSGKIRGVNAVEPVPIDDHFLNWLKCIRSGETPIAPIEAGFTHSVASIMSVRAMDTGKRITYDPEKRQIIEA
jgi:predicted dehydrogenase